MPLSPQVEYPDEFPIAEYATNVGLALLARGKPRVWRRGASGQNVVSLNLLSERHIPTPLPFGQVAVFLVLALLGVATFNVTPTVDKVSEDAAAKAEELVSTQEEERLYRIGRGGVTKIQRDVRDTRSQTLRLKSRIEELSEELVTLKVSFDRIEEIIHKTRPAGISVSNFTPKEEAFTLSGKAPTLDEAIKYADSIRASPLFTSYDVDVRQVGSNAGGDSLTFLIEATVRPSEGEEESSP